MIKTDILNFRNAAEERQKMTERCRDEYFQRFGAEDRMKRGDFETPEPLPPEDSDIESCSLSELDELKSAVLSYANGVSDWENLCERKFGTIYALRSVWWHDFLRKLLTIEQIKAARAAYEASSRPRSETTLNDNHGVVVSGSDNTIHIHLGKDGADVEQKGRESYLDMLDREVRARLAVSQQPRYILLPVQAAILAGVPLPFSNVDQFNARYNSAISPTGWSRWINGAENCNYGETELQPYYRMFGGE